MPSLFVGLMDISKRFLELLIVTKSLPGTVSNLWIGIYAIRAQTTLCHFWGDRKKCCQIIYFCYQFFILQMNISLKFLLVFSHDPGRPLNYWFGSVSLPKTMPFTGLSFCCFFFPLTSWFPKNDVGIQISRFEGTMVVLPTKTKPKKFRNEFKNIFKDIFFISSLTSHIQLLYKIYSSIRFRYRYLPIWWHLQRKLFVRKIDENQPKYFKQMTYAYWYRSTRYKIAIAARWKKNKMSR